MRVHGSTRISRKTDIEKQPYSKYLDSLREDFGCICGYCGKSELVTKNTFEIDHFIPRRLAPERENTYSNLVYACYECNRKKAGKLLIEKRHQLEEKIKYLSCDEARQYIEVSKALEKLQQILFECKE